MPDHLTVLLREWLERCGAMGGGPLNALTLETLAALEDEPQEELVHYRIVRFGRPLARRYESEEEAFGVLRRMGGDGEIKAYNAAGKVVRHA